MSLVPFNQLMTDAERGNYAVGYFESWNLESLLAVCDAAEAQRSPVILGFSGIALPHPERLAADPLSVVSAMARAAAERLSVPCALLFNESPNLDWIKSAIDEKYSLVMYTPEGCSPQEQIQKVRAVVEQAHANGVSVEGEMSPPPGLSGDLTDAPAEHPLTDPQEAKHFVERTGIDALAVNVGQVHLHGRKTVRLDLDRLNELQSQLAVPLVLHGATSVDQSDLQAATRLGIRKVNVGSILKQAYFNALADACQQRRQHPNPYAVIGSGLKDDVLMAGRLAMLRVVEEFMQCLGSAGRAGSRS